MPETAADSDGSHMILYEECEEEEPLTSDVEVRTSNNEPMPSNSSRCAL